MSTEKIVIIGEMAQEVGNVPLTFLELRNIFITRSHQIYN